MGWNDNTEESHKKDRNRLFLSPRSEQPNGSDEGDAQKARAPRSGCYVFVLHSVTTPLKIHLNKSLHVSHPMLSATDWTGGIFIPSSAFLRGLKLLFLPNL